MTFAALLIFIFLLALSGRRATRGTYALIAVAAIVASAYEYLS